MNTSVKKIILVLMVMFVPAACRALSPMVQYNDLIAGEGDPGYSDGPFYSAQFNNPTGLALNEDGSVLYVADTNNQCIRAIDLNNQNNVQTVTGTAGVAGYKDGPCSIALFNKPMCLTSLPGNRIAVSDGLIETDGIRIRVIDLNLKTVSTLVGSSISGADADTAKTQLSVIGSMVYFPLNDSLCFTEPLAGTMRSLALKTGTIKTIVQKNDLVPHPAALGVSGNKVYIADRDLGKIYEVSTVDSADGAAAVVSPILSTHVWTGAHQITALAGTATSLYAYESAPVSQTSPIIRVFPDPGILQFDSVWGYAMAEAQSFLPQFSTVQPGQLLGFIPDSRSEGRFYVTNPSRCAISSFRDLRFGNPVVDASFGAPDFVYPTKKPFRTFRILMTGRSHLFWETDRNWDERGAYEPPMQVNILTLMSRRLEVYLNTLAALEDVPIHFEVLNQGRVIDSTSFVWPYYETPEMAKRYDVDMVLMMTSAGENVHHYYQAPITSEGIPEEKVNIDFNNLPDKEKFKTGPLRDFFDLVAKKKKDPGMSSFGQWLADPELKNKLIDILGLPIGLLKKKLGLIKASEDKSCQLCVCYYPAGSNLSPSKPERAFWKEVAAKNSVAFLDLTDDFVVTRYTFCPISDMQGPDHFTKDGHMLMAQLLAYELIKNKIIPFKTYASK
jgi:DNA-binding beta-propeller fold protein YncE